MKNKKLVRAVLMPGCAIVVGVAYLPAPMSEVAHGFCAPPSLCGIAEHLPVDGTHKEPAPGRRAALEFTVVSSATADVSGFGFAGEPKPTSFLPDYIFVLSPEPSLTARST